MGKIILELEEDENALIDLFYYFCGHSQSSKRAPLNEAAGILHSHKQWEISAELAVRAVKSAVIHSAGSRTQVIHILPYGENVKHANRFPSAADFFNDAYLKRENSNNF